MERGGKEEILEAIGTFAESVDRRFERVESDISCMKSQMVTKSYLDDKLSDLKGDMVAMLRKENRKVNRLVGVLAEKGTLTPIETREVLSFRPFP